MEFSCIRQKLLWPQGRQTKKLGCGGGGPLEPGQKPLFLSKQKMDEKYEPKKSRGDTLT